MTIATDDRVTYQPSGVSPIRSHQSLEEGVYAVCHHSGRYLTRAETNPGFASFLREQHDFPGLPELDRHFARAAHGVQHQHYRWSTLGITTMAILISAIVVLWFTFGQLYPLVDFLETPYETSWVYTSIIVGAVVGVGLLLWGLWRVALHESLYHEDARNQALPPQSPDFPITATYDVDIKEHVKVNLGNVSHPTIIDQASQLTIDVRPVDVDEMHKLHHRFRDIYHAHGVGRYLHAGTVAVQGVRGLRFDTPLEFEHRVVLRSPNPLTLRSTRYNPRDGALVRHELPYVLTQDAFYDHPQGESQKYFPLDIYPVLSPTDSYTLEIHFRWCRDDIPHGLILEMCHFENIRRDYPELGSVVHVERGRYDEQKDCIVWRNLPFRGRELVLQVTFEDPILTSNAILQGKYRCYIGGLLSALEIDKAHIWDARGLPLSSDSSVLVARQSTVEGGVTLDTSRLTQLHEHASGVMVQCHCALDEGLIHALLDVLVQYGVTLHWIEHPEPQRDPKGTDIQAVFWDMGGSLYRPEILDNVEVHLVITGRTARRDTSPDIGEQIDLRIRCLYDPRDPHATEHADVLFENLHTSIKSIAGTPAAPTA